MENEKRMRSIWFFVGLIMLVIGILVFLAGIYDLINPSVENIKLISLHTNIWWGALIAITGLIYTVKNKNKYVDE
jgi:divalent metal cation (Fe/Co/Zn/Cd) transporter